jgi:hypothetical protein
VDAFMARLEHPLKEEIEVVRRLILGADRRIGESIKWNAPSFFIEDHFATLKLQPAVSVQVVLHTGAKAKSNSRSMAIKDPAGLVKWAAKDRGLVTFTNMDDVRSKKAAFVAILKQWIQKL